MGSYPKKEEEEEYIGFQFEKNNIVACFTIITTTLRNMTKVLKSFRITSYF